MAFLNAVGFDKEVANMPMHPVRTRVREMVSASLRRHPDKLSAWKKRYADWNLQPFHYQDFALSFTPDYPFRRVRQDSELGYPQTARRLREFPDILNDFWTTVDLPTVWEAVKPDYLAELGLYDLGRMAADLSSTWQYLRMTRSDSFVLVSIPNLLDSHYQAIGASYGRFYYSVESPGASAHTLNVHEYLHYIINPLVKANSRRQHAKLRAYFDAGKTGPMARTYQEEVTFVYECLVRALDSRIDVTRTKDAEVRARIERRVANETERGLNLVRPFYILLAEFEEARMPFNQYLPILLERLPRHNATY